MVCAVLLASQCCFKGVVRYRTALCTMLLYVCGGTVEGLVRDCCRYRIVVRVVSERWKWCLLLWNEPYKGWAKKTLRGNGLV